MLEGLTMDEQKEKPVAFQVRGSDEYKRVVKLLAKHDRRSMASLVDRALRVYAEQIGFPIPIPER